MLPTTEIITITPALAEEWLGKNRKNRRVKNQHVQTLALDIREGNWRLNGEAIKFAADGTLLDGQHRLTAIATAGVPVQALVVRGVEPDAQRTIDTGSRRTASDMLTLEGEKSTSSLAAGIRACIMYSRGTYAFGSAGRYAGVTNEQIMTYLEQHPEIREYEAAARRVTKTLGLNRGTGTLAVKLFHEIDLGDAEHFFERLASDQGHYAGEPIYELRKALLQEKERVRTGHGPKWKLGMTIKAWNKYRLGEPVSSLRFNLGGANPEKFPEPI